MTDVYRFQHQLKLTRCWQAALSLPVAFTGKPWCNNCGWHYTLLYMITVFENTISNKLVTFQSCRATLVGMCLKSLWREPGNYEPLLPFLHWLVWRESVLRLWEALPFPLISPCGTCTAASTCEPSAKSEHQLHLRGVLNKCEHSRL